MPITPCRLVDTRATDTVGTRSTQIGASEAVTFDVWGTNGACTIPDSAVGIATNTTAVNPTGDSYLTVWPGDDQQPLASNLNWLRIVGTAVNVAPGSRWKPPPFVGRSLSCTHERIRFSLTMG